MCDAANPLGMVTFLKFWTGLIAQSIRNGQHERIDSRTGGEQMENGQLGESDGCA